MDFVSAVKSAFSKYATFEGRASRSEFWWFFLFTILVNSATTILDGAFGFYLDSGEDIGAIGALVSLALLLPSLALSSRRLHDVDHTFWWYLLAFTGVGLIVLLIWACMKGTTGDNRFGPDPLAAESAADVLVPPTPM